MTRIRTVLLLILISLIVTLSIQITEKFSSQPDTRTAQPRNSNIDYSIDNFTLTTMDIQGNTQYHLNAASMQHFQQSDETLLKSPTVNLHNQSGEQWLIRSKNGKVAAKGKSIMLTGKVAIERTATKQQKPLIITTESLLIVPDDNTISTRETITLTGDGITLQSKGMLTNIQTETINLLGKVRATYAP